MIIIVIVIVMIIVVVVIIKLVIVLLAVGAPFRSTRTGKLHVNIIGFKRTLACWTCLMFFSLSMEIQLRQQTRRNSDLVFYVYVALSCPLRSRRCLSRVLLVISSWSPSSSYLHDVL